jgi:hypothetical protein
MSLNVFFKDSRSIIVAALISSRFLYIVYASTPISAISIVTGHHTAMNAPFTNASHQAIAVNHVTSEGIIIHKAPTASVNQDIAATTRNTFFAVSGFSFHRAVNLSRYGINAFIQSTMTSSNHHSITCQSANHHSAASATPTLSFKVDTTPLNVADFLSIIPKNNHHADVASIIVCFTMSKLICQSSIFSRSDAMLSPVLSDIAFNGLNHKLINCNKSCHVSFQAEDI